MKRIAATIICLLLIFTPLASWLPTAEAAPPTIKVTGYSVSGVLNRPNSYAITLNMELEGAGSLSTLSVSAAAGAYEQALSGGSTISKEPIAVSSTIVSRLNDNREASATFYFIKTDQSDATNELTILFTDADGLDDKGSFDMKVVKTVPDPVEDDDDDYDDDDDDTPTDTSKYKPILGVDGESKMPLLTPDSAVLTIPIKNMSGHSARKITVRAEPADKSRPIFNANQMSITDTISSLRGNGTWDAKFDVSLAPGATTGLHTISLTYTYTNTYGDEFSSSETAYIQVEANNAAPRLGAYCATSVVTPGAETKTKFTIKNSGRHDARNIKITLSGLSASGISLRGDTDVRYLDLIAGEESADVDFNLYAASSVTDSAAMLQVKLDYTDISGVEYSETNTIFLPLGTGSGESQGVPRLIINRYGFGAQGIRAGAQFVLQMDLQNTSRSKSISNLKVTILSDDGAFLPVDASNTLFIEQIFPQEVYSASLLLAAKADAENKPYSLRITFDYETSNGDAHNSQEVISIPVQQNPRLMVGDPVIYGEAFMYQMLPVNVEFYNLGKTMLYNLMVSAEGPFQIEGGNYFVGNFDPGASDSFNFTVTPTEVGAVAGGIVFSFEDSVGNPIEVRRDFDLNVMEPFIPDDQGMKPPIEPEKPNYLLYGGIGAGVLLLAGLAFFLLRRRKKLRLNLQRAEDMVAAAQTEIPEIEYVGFGETEPEESQTEAEPKE